MMFSTAKISSSAIGASYFFILQSPFVRFAMRCLGCITVLFVLYAHFGAQRHNSFVSIACFFADCKRKLRKRMVIFAVFYRLRTAFLFKTDSPPFKPSLLVKKTGNAFAFPVLLCFVGVSSQPITVRNISIYFFAGAFQLTSNAISAAARAFQAARSRA